MAARNACATCLLVAWGCAATVARPIARTLPVTAAEEEAPVIEEPEPVAEDAPAKLDTEEPTAPLCAPDAPGAVPCLTLTPSEPRPGDLVMIDLFANADAASAVIFSHSVPLFRFGNHFRGFDAVPLRALATPRPAHVELTRDNGPSAFRCADTDVGERAFSREELVVAHRYASRHQKTTSASAALADEASPIVSPLPVPLRSSSLFLWPKQGTVTTAFGVQRLFNGKLSSRHLGIDISGVVGERVFASQAGVVRFSGKSPSSGETLIVDHGAGLMTYYMHLSERQKGYGQTVAQGEVIGLVGRTGRVTGPNLHFAVSVHGRYVDPETVLAHPMFASGNAAPCQAADTASVR